MTTAPDKKTKPTDSTVDPEVDPEPPAEDSTAESSDAVVSPDKKTWQ